MRRRNMRNTSMAMLGIFALISTSIAPVVTSPSFAADAVPSGSDVYVLISDGSSNRYFLKSNGDGTFGPMTLFVLEASSVIARGGSVADFDEDGIDVDFITCSPSNVCILRRQTAPGVFEDPGTPIIGYGSISITEEAASATEDFNQDGHMDFVTSGPTYALFEGTGAGNFVLQPFEETTAGTDGRDAADIDGNGFPDVIVGTVLGDVLWYKNVNGEFSPPVLLFSIGQLPAISIAAADFDGDGYIDIIAGDEAGTLTFWKMNDAMNFVLSHTVYAFPYGAGIANYDFDGDGDQDLVAMPISDFRPSYLENAGNGVFDVSPIGEEWTYNYAAGIATPPSPPIRSTLSGLAFNDANGNGVKDDVPGGFADVTLALTGTDYLGHAVSRSTVTAADGSYSFADVLISNADGYTLTATESGTQTPTTTETRTVAIPRENTHAAEDFGYSETAPCTDADGDGFAIEGGACGPVDCNDASAAVNPGAEEICNGIDDDCDGTTDEGFDQDGDGYTTCGGDCNDSAQTSVDASVTITVSNIVSTGPGADMTEGIFVGNGAAPAGIGTVTIPLTVNGTPIVDPASSPDVTGIHVLRGIDNGEPFIRISAYGHNKNTTREHAEGTITLNGAVVSLVKNGPNGPYEKHADGKCTGQPGNDEYAIQLGGTAGTFCTTTNVHSDNVTIMYKPESGLFCNQTTNCSDPQYASCGVCIHPGAADPFGDGIDNDCDGASVCGMKMDYDTSVNRCKGTAVVKSDAELATYLETFGLSKGAYKDLRIAYDINKSFVDIHSPCRIFVKTKKTITGDAVCIDGRRGVRANPHVTIIGEKVALLSERGSVWVTTKGTVQAMHELLMKAWKKVIVGVQSVVSGQSSTRLLAVGPEGKVSANAKASVTAASLEIAGTKRARLGPQSSFTIAGNFRLDAPQCVINKKAVVSAGSKSGRCFASASQPDTGDDGDDDLNDPEGENE